MRNLSVSDDNKHSIADMEGLEVLVLSKHSHSKCGHSKEWLRGPYVPAQNLLYVPAQSVLYVAV